jgi:argininosuccinate lyase
MAASTFPDSEYERTVLRPAYKEAAAHLYAHMLAAHEAHAIMLAECHIISAANAASLLSAVAQVRSEGVENLVYKRGVEDLFFAVEARIIQLAGADDGGNLQLARSRNDLGQALARMALRPLLLDLGAALLLLRRTILEAAQRHLHTLMPGYTHTQPAQPVTFAHYLAGVLTALEKDQRRLGDAYANVNESPLGAAAFTGTGFAIDRERVAALLGFDRVITSTQHSIGAADHLTDCAYAIQSLAIGLGRVTRDLLFLATQESGAIRIDDSFIQISSIMPQKRNPVVLEHLRARLSRALGAAHTVAIQCHNIPYGDTQDIEDEIWPPLTTAIDAAQQSLTLYRELFATLELRVDHLAAQAAKGFTTATEVADTLVRRAGLSFRQAHTLVAAAVSQAAGSARGITAEVVQQAAQRTLGRTIEITAAEVEQALDPRHFINIRTVPGGVAPQATAALLDTLAHAIDEDDSRLQHAKEGLLLAEEMRTQAAQTLRQSYIS